MPDEATTPPDSTHSNDSGQASQQDSGQAGSTNSLQAGSLDEARDKSPQAEPNTPTPPSPEAPPSQEATDGHGTEGQSTPSVGTDTPPQAGGEETPAPPKSEDPEEQQAVDGAGATGQVAEVSEAVAEPVQANPPAPQTEPPPLGKEELKNTGIIDSTPSINSGQAGSLDNTRDKSRQVGELLVKARAKIQERRRKKLEKIMEALDGRGPTSLKLRRVNAITNDEVEKLLRVSDATATRYLDILEKEGRVRQEGKTGKYVVYVKIEEFLDSRLRGNDSEV